MPVLPCYFWFLESPRWLLARGRVEAAAEIFEKKIMVRNGRSLPAGVDLTAVLTRIAKVGKVQCALE